MTIESVKKQVCSQKGKKLHFIFYGARNQTEEFDGKIIETYPGIFLVSPSHQEQIVKSFSYSDVLTLHLEIKEEG